MGGSEEAGRRADADRHLGALAAFAVEHLFECADALGCRLRREVEAEPAVAFARDSAERGVRLAAENDRRVGRLDRLGRLAAGRQRVELAFVGGDVIEPEAAHDLQILFGARAAAGPRHAQRSELFAQPADAHAEIDAPVRKAVNGGHLLGCVHRVSLRDEGDARAQAHLFCCGGEESEDVERVQHARVRAYGQLAVLGVGVLRCVLVEEDHVFWRPDGGEAEVVGGSADDHQEFGRGDGREERWHDADFHVGSLRFVCGQF